MDPSREFLRHTVATLAYRGGKTLRGAPPGFGSWKPDNSTRTAGEILGHLGDLLDWALLLAKGEPRWEEPPRRGWDGDVARFFDSLGAFDSYLASDAPLAAPAEKLFQGPIADALTHVGQISIFRRLVGSPVRGENYFKADIATGSVGIEQPPPRVEFD